jgi:hypothetical protein
VKWAAGKTVRNLHFLLFAIAASSVFAAAQATDVRAGDASSGYDGTAALLKKVDQLVEQNVQLEKQNRELIEEIGALRQAVAKKPSETTQGLERAVLESVPPETSSSSVAGPSITGRQSNATTLAANPEEQKTWGTYTPNFGFKIANTEYGDASLSIYTYARYLNQLGLQSTYTNAFGVTTQLQRRQDFQLQKLQMKFLGWMMSPKFRYFLYAWTSNANQGLGAQVVLAGNLNYSFTKYFNVGAGIYSLPGTRSVEGNFPFWLSVDSRHIADEFFRPSYSSGVRASGAFGKGMSYQVMIANNLSTLGVAAAQLDNSFNTIASAFVWTPTTGEFGAGWGDFENHEKVATRLGVHYTRSHENKESQPNTDQFENTQLRLSDGSIIFTPNLFGPGITITDADDHMTSFDGGVKYRGYALEGEYYMRWLNHFHGPGTAGLNSDFSNGFQLQSSAMLLPKTLQLYLGGSYIMGHYGRPWDLRTGLNYFPFRNRVVRWNSELLYLYRSPVGYTSVPFPFGGTGPVFHTTLEMAF